MASENCIVVFVCVFDVDVAMILFRKVAHTKDIQDTELFVVLENRKWVLPAQIPARFVHRTTSDGQVISTPFAHATLLSKDTLQTTGFWITREDTTIVGDVGVPTVFGFPLTASVCRAFESLPRRTDECKIMVGYHGTSLKHFKQIQADNRMKPSFGQLGTGVYVGNVWKAFRFASRDQDYAWRDVGVLMRVLWLKKPTGNLDFPLQEPCTCTLCLGRSRDVACACGHKIDWKGTLCSGFLPPLQTQAGTWISRNEEWVVNADNVLALREAVQIDLSTVCQTHHDPLQREFDIH